MFPKNPTRALEIGAKFGGAAVSRDLRPNIRTFYHTGEGLNLGKKCSCKLKYNFLGIKKSTKKLEPSPLQEPKTNVENR